MEQYTDTWTSVCDELIGYLIVDCGSRHPGQSAAVCTGQTGDEKTGCCLILGRVPWHWFSRLTVS